MEFAFEIVEYDKSRPIAAISSLPKRSAVYRIFDTRGKLIVLDKTSNLHARIERFYGERTEPVRDLDLREITGRIEYLCTHSTFETQYILYRQRRQFFPKTYRKMRTFRLFTLMKINKKQRFPRIYATRQIKKGVDYFGPFVSRGQFSRLKTTLERTFKLRPCPYNIRGNDPHPDCLYFQMHTCSRPCNNDIGRNAYLEDVFRAMAFIQGRDEEIEAWFIGRMNDLAGEMKFEDAELLRRRLEKIQHARKDQKETFLSVWNFQFIVLLPGGSVSRCKIAFVRNGSIVGFEEYDIETLQEKLECETLRFLEGELEPDDAQYDDFCLVSNFIVSPLRSVEVIPAHDYSKAVAETMECIRRRKKRKEAEMETPID